MNVAFKNASIANSVLDFHSGSNNEQPDLSNESDDERVSEGKGTR